MVYDWEGKEEPMRKLYIHQGKSLEEVMEWFRINQNFTPRYVAKVRDVPHLAMGFDIGGCYGDLCVAAFHAYQSPSTLSSQQSVQHF